MKREERDEWVAALRSGEFEQGRRALNRGGKYCCLGVKCELDTRAGRMDRKATVDLRGEASVLFVSGDVFCYREPSTDKTFYRDAFPDAETLIRWGVSDTYATRLASMNDDGKSFAEIADWIEEHIEVDA